MVNSKKKGYTLIELTISIGLLGLVIVLTAGVLISVVRSYQRQRVIAEIERNADHAMRVVEESLIGALSVNCVDARPNPSTYNAIDTPCDAVNNGDDGGRLLRISYGHMTTYISAAAGAERPCTSNPNSNCYILISSSPTIPPDPTNLKLTNDSLNNGVNVEEFTFGVGSGSGTGGPTVVIATITISGAKGTVWEEETRTFQSFLTVRGTYK